MGRTILVFFERLLIAAVSVLIAAIIIGLFLRALRGPNVVTSTVDGDAHSVTADATSTTQTARITFAEGPCEEEPPLEEAGLSVVTVFYTCGNAALPRADAFVYRRVPESETTLATTMKELLQGPSTSEAALGFRSVFSVATAGTLDSVVVEGSEAIVDFASLPSVTGLAAADDVGFFVANLNANVFQFPGISSVEYRLGGSCAAFWEHLGDDSGCRIIALENHEATIARNRAD